MNDVIRTSDEKCPQVGDVIHCHCGKPSSHYGTMGYRGAREVREQPVALTSNSNDDWIDARGAMPPQDVPVLMVRRGSEQIPLWHWKPVNVPETEVYCDRRRHNFVKLPGGTIATCTHCNRPEPKK